MRRSSSEGAAHVVSRANQPRPCLHEDGVDRDDVKALGDVGLGNREGCGARLRGRLGEIGHGDDTLEAVLLNARMWEAQKGTSRATCQSLRNRPEKTSFPEFEAGGMAWGRLAMGDVNADPEMVYSFNMTRGKCRCRC